MDIRLSQANVTAVPHLSFGGYISLLSLLRLGYSVLLLMPSTITRPFTSTFSAPSQVPEEVWCALESHPVNSNVILPILEKCLQREQRGIQPSEEQFWISCSSYNPHPAIEFVLSVTSNDLDRYPIFITTTCAYNELTPEFLHPRMTALVKALDEVVHSRRVYSVFAPEPVAVVFCQIWSELTGIRPYTEPYYHANVSYCNRKSVYRSATLREHHTHNYELRPAVPEDQSAVAELCKGFSNEGVSVSDCTAFLRLRPLFRNPLFWTTKVPIMKLAF